MKDIVYKILWSTIEDFVGLWEILWELNSLLPENSQKENQEISKKILRYFLKQDLVTIYLSKWGSDERKAKDSNEALNLIENDNYWNPPAINELCVKVGNTEKGEKCYNEELIGDFI
jgi:hypothetical protein